MGLSLFDVMTDIMGYQLTYTQHSGIDQQPLGVGSPAVAPYGAFPTRDGQTVVLGTTNDREWQRVAREIIDRPDLADDARFATNTGRCAHRDILDEAIGSWCAQHDLAHIQKVADQAGIGNSRYNLPSEVVVHPQLTARDRWRPVGHPEGADPGAAAAAGHRRLRSADGGGSRAGPAHRRRPRRTRPRTRRHRGTARTRRHRTGVSRCRGRDEWSRKMRETVIVEAVRTPVGKRNGGLSDMHAADLSALVLTALVERAGIDPGIVDDVVWGCVSQVGDQSSNIGRYSVLAAGWPETIPGTTVNRACGSSQQALDFAVQAVMSGQQDVVVAGGVEVMSRVPLGAARATGMPYGPKVLARYGDFSFNQGISAEMIAQKWGFSRTRLDEYSALSHERAAAAQDSGAFETQMIPVFTGGEPVVADEGVRRGTSVEKLAGLKPAFKDDGVIHAGNSSQISDGAAALLVMAAENAVALGLTPIARYRAGAVTGADPVLMLTGPIPATEKVLHKAGVGLDEVGVFEVNEAFAPVPLAWLEETGADEKRLNPLGGAIALGHPLGASGAVLMTRMLNHMRDNGIRYGLQTMCEGGGTANATLGRTHRLETHDRRTPRASRSIHRRPRGVPGAVP